MRIQLFESWVAEKKKPKGAPDWHDSDAPDAKGKFRELGINDLADWLIKTRKKNVQRITGSLNQQIVFNRGKDAAYAEKMEKVRKAVYRKLGRKDLLESSLMESLGDGVEVFTDKLSVYGLGKNLSIDNLPLAIGDELEDASGTIKYQAELEVGRSGIESISFSIIEIILNLEVTRYQGEDDEDGKTEEETIHIVGKDLGEESVTVEIANLPFYVSDVEIDLADCEDLDGELDMSKAVLNVKFGYDKD
jgi:hypothetical protein